MPADPIEREALAHRLVAERCLYGVDKNPMAVEMAKLSLWLITLAKDRPFSFVDHALRAGDSLLGVTDLKQLRVAHLDPSWHRQASLDLGFDEVEAAVDRALALRHELEAFVVRDVLDAERKATMLAQADAALDDARLLGDLVVGAALAQLDDADPLASADVARSIRTMVDHEAPELERMVARTQLRALAETWLVETRRAVGEVPEVVWDDRHPFHWALEFPEVRERGGFDAIVGNPPFQGGKKISGALGGQYRDYLVEWLAGGARGNADLVAYFYLRAVDAAPAERRLRADRDEHDRSRRHPRGRARPARRRRVDVHRAICQRAVARRRQPRDGDRLGAARRLGGSECARPQSKSAASRSALTTRSRVEGSAHRLHANRDRSFIGSVVSAMGFVLSPSEAAAMLAADPRNADVVRPYLVGEDLNQRPDGSPSRWVIDFRDWPEERAREYVSAVRARRGAGATRAHASSTSEATAALVAVRATGPGALPGNRIARPLHRDHAASARPSSRCSCRPASSSPTSSVSLPTTTTPTSGCSRAASTGGGRSRTRRRCGPTSATRPTDCFETFAQPELTDAVGILGGELNEHRSALMLDRQEGLTKTYNRVHDPDEHADDIARLRELHVELDYAVRDAYGWTDLDLGHDFHETKFGTRFTFAPAPRQEVLDRLLELNHARYAEEVAQGLHGKPKAKGKRKAAPGGVDDDGA